MPGDFGVETCLVCGLKNFLMFPRNQGGFFTLRWTAFLRLEVVFQVFGVTGPDPKAVVKVCKLNVPKWTLHCALGST